jgi:hypothetical protein
MNETGATSSQNKIDPTNTIDITKLGRPSGQQTTWCGVIDKTPRTPYCLSHWPRKDADIVVHFSSVKYSLRHWDAAA